LELNGILAGAYWLYFLEGGGRCREARIAPLDRLRELARGDIPASAFKSVRAWKEYLQGKY
jgi:hypothetical protein